MCNLSALSGQAFGGLRLLFVLLALALVSAPLGAEEKADEKKIVVLGIDALDPQLMKQWMDEGRLPHFARLAAQGEHAPLQTSYPPMSPCAWSTMATGLNPGRTGIFDFLRRKKGSYKPELALAEPNETPLLGGSRPARAVLGLVFGFVWLALGVALGKLAAALIAKVRGRAPKLPEPATAGAALAVVLLSPWTANGGPATVGLVLGGLTLLAGVFGYGVCTGGLKLRAWLFPWLALAFALFALFDRLPESLPKPVTARSGETFWKTAGKHGIRTRVIGAPVDWPADDTLSDDVRLTTGLSTPDAMGTFHTYTLFTEPPHALAGGQTEMAGRIERLVFDDSGTAEAVLLGPPAKFDTDRWRAFEEGSAEAMPREEIHFEVRREDDGVRLVFRPEDAGEESEISLREGEWARHFPVRFDLGGLLHLAGRVSFKLLAGGGGVRLYATPVQFDPADTPDAFRVAQPAWFGAWLAAEYGMYQTLGWAEATSALNDGVIDDQTFVETCYHSLEEKRAQILGLLDHADEWDLLAAFTYEVDRMCHMMWRHMDAAHPNHDPFAPASHKTAIRDLYEAYDALLGEVMEKLPPGAVLLVVSDHGFSPFYRSVNLNRWLVDEGYLALKQETGKVGMEGLFSGRASYYDTVDWSKTRAYALGLSKIYVNQRGREPEGIVDPGHESECLLDELQQKLSALRDDEAHGFARVVHGVYRATDVWEGPRTEEAGDLLAGFARGYRVSWQTSLGGASEPLIDDNLRNWSGDHCSFAPELVPGVVFCNRAIEPSESKALRLIDVAPTVLRFFDVPFPTEYGPRDGRPWAIHDP